MISFYLNAVLLVFILIISIAILRMRNLFAAIMLTGLFSLLCAAIFVDLDAVDVAFTEAAVGAGISTVLMLGALALIGSDARDRSQTNIPRKALALSISLLTAAILVYGTVDMPHFGDANAPAQQHLAPHYLTISPQETGVPNVVTAVLASYRGYDTMGETLVVFTAGIAVFGLLGNVLKRQRKKELPASSAENEDIVLATFAKLMVPLIILFGLYVQFHGDFGPGGGFQAGVTIAAALVLYGLVFSVDELMLAVPLKAIRILMAAGISLYAGTGIVTMLLGGQFLDYNLLAQDSMHGQHYGIFIVELGVGISVAAVMLSLYYSFMNHRPLQRKKGR